LRQNSAIGIGAINRNQQGAMGQGRALIQRIAQGLDNASPDIGEAELFTELFVFFAVRIRGLLVGFARKFGGLKANWQRPRRARLRGRDDQRGLNETKAGDEVDAILGSERIAPSRNAGNAESGFTEDGIIHGDNDGHGIRGQKA
jgi:hypothetical protein